MPLNIRNIYEDEEEQRRREAEAQRAASPAGVQSQTVAQRTAQAAQTPQLTPPKPVQYTQPQNAQQSLLRREDSTINKWYKGSQPTNAETLAQIYRIGSTDPVKGEELWQQYNVFRQDPTSPIYDPYASGTNYALKALGELGVDVSAGVTPEWLNENQGYLQHLKYTQAGNVQAPTKRSKKEEKIAYQMYQLFKDEEQTEQAESEWKALQEEISYWAHRDDLNLSDEEIMSKVSWDKYKTLQSMDANRESPISFNRAIGYNQDAISGVIWAARNGVDTDDGFNAVRAALGQGKPYQRNEELHQRLTPGSDTYAPYSVCTLDDAALYFGVDSFDQQWLNDHMAYRDSADETARTMYNSVYKAEQTTRKAEEEMARLREVLDKRLANATDPDRVLKQINWEKDYPTLYAMNETRNGGPKLMTTRGIDFDQGAITKEITDKCQHNKLAKTGRALCEWFSNFTGLNVEYDENLIAVNQNRSNNIQSGTETIETNGTPEEQVVFKSGSSPTQDADMLDLSNQLDSPNFDGQGSYNYILQNADEAAVRDYLPAHATITEYEELQKRLQEIETQLQPPIIGEQLKSFVTAEIGPTGMTDFAGGNTNGLPLVMKKIFAELNEKGIKNPMDPNLTPEQRQIVDEVFKAHSQMVPNGSLISTDQQKAQEEQAKLENERSQILAEMEAMQDDYQDAVKTVQGIQEQYDAGDVIAKLTGSQTSDGYKMLAMQDEYFNLGKDPVAINRESYSAYDMMLHFPGVDMNAVQQFAAMDKAKYQEEIRRIDEMLNYLTKGNTDYSFINRDLSMDRGGVEYYKNIMDRRAAYERQIKAADYFLIRTNPDFLTVAQTERDNINSGQAGRVSQIDMEAAADTDTYELQPGNDTYMIAMDDDERDTYLYIRATQGADAAKAYYDYMTDRTYGPMITRMADRASEIYEQIGKDAPILGTLMTIAGSPFQAAGTIYSVVANMLGMDINPSDPAFDAVRFNNEIRGAAKEGITKYWGEGTVGAFIGNLLYDAGTSAADSLLNAFIFGGLGSGVGSLEATTALEQLGLKATSSLISAAPMGLQAASSAIWDAKHRGATNEQALLMGGFTFLSETVTEALTFDNIADSYALGQAADAASWKKAFVKFATKYLDEPVGEGLSEIIGKLSDTAIMGKLSEKEQIIAAYTADGKMSPEAAEAQYWRDFWSDVGMASLTAIISSGAQTIVSYEAGQLNQAGQDRSMQKAVTEAEQVASDLQVQLESDPNNTTLQQRFAAAKEEVEARRQALRDFRATREAPTPEAQAQELQDSVTEAEQEVADIQAEMEANPDNTSLQDMLATANEELAKRQQALADFRAKAEAAVAQMQPPRPKITPEEREQQVDERGNVVEPTEYEGRHAGEGTARRGQGYEGRHSVQTEEGAQEAAENVARVDENGNVVEPYEGRHTATEGEYEGQHAATPDPYEVVVSEPESNYRGQHAPAPEVVVSQPIQNGSRIARQIEMLGMADSINASGQAAAMGAVLMPSTQRDLYSVGLASAAGQHLEDKYGPSAVHMLRRAITATAQNGGPVEALTTTVAAASLAEEGSPAARALDVLVEESTATGRVSPQNLQGFQAIVMGYMAQNGRIAEVQKKVKEHLTASKIREYVAEGALKDVGPFEIALQHAMEEQQDAGEALKREEGTQQQMQDNLKAVHEEFLKDAGNPKKQIPVTRAIDNLDGQIKVVEEYGMRKENADQAVTEAEKKLDQKRNETLTPLREQAAAEVEQQMQAEQQQKAEEAAAAQEAQHQQTVQDQRSGKLKEESTRAKLQRRAAEKGLTGQAAENYVNSVLQHARDRELNKIDMTRQLSATDADLVMGSLERRFGVKVKTEELADGINGYYDRATDSITLNKKLPAGQILVEFGLHELTHSLEQTGAYQQYHDMALNILFPTQAEMDSAVADKIASYDAQGIRIDTAQALREIVADFTRTRLNSADVVQRMVEGGVGGRMRAALHNINQFLRNKLTRMDPETRRTAENLRRAERMFQKALNEKEKANKQKIDEMNRQANTPEGKLQREATPVTTTSDGTPLTGELRDGTMTKEYSAASWTEAQKAKVKADLIKYGYSPEQAQKWIDDINGVASTILSDRGRLDYEVTDPEKRMLKPNQDYYFTVDASTLCAKRLLYQGTFDAIQHLLPNTALQPGDLIDLSNMMRDMGYETPCGICYVESRRRWLGEYAKEWLDNYDGEYKPRLDEVTTSDGLEKLRTTHPKAYEDFTAAMKAKGSANPKVVQLRTDYRGEIAEMTVRDVEKVKAIGGLRIQSFSDFEVPHLIDMMQAVMDMSAKGLTAQAYTKVPAFAAVFGDTGIKINLSEIGKGSGINIKNGMTFEELSKLPYEEAKDQIELVYDDVEGMPHERAIELRNQYGKNVGTILVGMNNDHVIAAMGADDVDFIIPFHKSGWSQNELDRMPVLNSYDDYTDSQNERIILGKKTKVAKKGVGQKAVNNWLASEAENHPGYTITKGDDGKFTISYPDGYVTESFSSHKDRTGESLSNYEPVGGHKYWDFEKSGPENAESYLEKCKKDGRLPKFSQFLVDNGDGSFSLPQGDDYRSTAIRNGYWKTLIDFKMYDNAGGRADQQVVTPNVNMDEAMKVLNDYSLDRVMPSGVHVTRESNNTLPVAQDVVDAYVAQYMDKHPGQEYSAGVDELTSAQLEAELEALLTDEDFAELGQELFGDQDVDEEETKTILTNAVQDIKDEFDPTIYNGRLYVKPDTMNHWLSGSGFAAPKSPSYAQAYIASMNPADFLRMTTTTEEGQNWILSKARTLDRADLGDNAKGQPIQLIIDEATGKVIGHEGRHRSVALARAGVTEMPVLLFDSATKNSKTPKDTMTLEGQDLNETTGNGNTITFTAVLPLSERYRDQIIERYTATDAERQAAAQGQQSILEYSAGNMTEEQMDQELIEAGVITPEELPPQRQFGRYTAQNSDLDEKVKAHLYNNSAYTPDTNKAQINRAIEWIHQMATKEDPSGFRNALQTIYDGTFDSRGADGQARILTLMSLAAVNGNLNDQVMLADFFNKEGTTAGQQMQARKMIRLMTPIGRIALLKQQANKLTDELARKGIKKEITLSDWTLQAAANAKTEEDFAKVRKAANEELADQLPVSWKERLQSWRMLAMLANPRTHVRNLVGNALFVPAVGLKNKLGAMMEGKKPVGQRTKTLGLTLSQGIKDFAKQDAITMKDVLTGEAKYNDRTAVQRNKQTLPGFLQAASDFNSGLLEKEDWFFLKGHYRRALGGWMQANGYTAEQLQANPDLLKQGREYAVQEAQKATYRDANQLAKTLSEVSRKGGALGMFVDAVLPFKKTPANILKRGIEYSPVGLIKSLTADAVHLKQYRDWQNGQYSKMPDKAITPNQWIDNICSGLSGSAIFALGVVLSNMGVISVGLDDDDDEFDKLEGDQEYSVKIFGHSYTLDWAAPACMPFFVGAAVRELSEREGGFDVQEALNAAANIAEPVFNLSMLDGVNSLFRTSQNDETNNLTQILAKVGTNYATSFYPSAFGAIDRAFFDPVRRKAFVKSGETGGILGQIRYAKEQTENKIPGLSQTNIPMRDAFGRTSSDNFVERILENFVSPGYHTTMQNDPVVEELRNLYETTGNRSMIPKLPNKTLTVNKKSLALEAEEYDKLTEERGSTAYKIISELMNSDFYKDASEKDRADMVTDAWTYATQTANHSVNAGYKMDTWVTNSMKNPTRSIINRCKDRVEKDYKDGCKIAAVEAVESEDFDALDTVIAKYEEAGGKKSQIKTAVGNAYKEEYLRAYQADDGPAMDEIEILLESTDLGFSDADFEKWIAGVENQIRDDEEEEE